MSAHNAAMTHDCKFPGCPNEARSSVGRYSYCDEHQNREARGLEVVKPAAARAGGTMAATIAGLAKDAKAVDAARAKAAKLADKALAEKRRADELQAAFETKMREVTGRAPA